jgi:hypothetical protein
MHVCRSASTLPHVSVSIVGCVNKIVHPYQRNPSAPGGVYSIDLTDVGARNMVREMVSKICRGRAMFSEGEVRHVSVEGDVHVLKIPQTKWVVLLCSCILAYPLLSFFVHSVSSHLSVCLPVSLCLSVAISIRLSVCLSVCCLSIRLTICICLSVCLSVCRCSRS